MTVDYKFDKSLYFFSASHYFAIAFAEMFHGKVCIWSYKLNNVDTFYFAFAKMVDGFYVDSYGWFTDISARRGMLQSEVGQIREYSVEEAKAFLKKMGVKYTDVEMKKNAREYLRNNMLAFEVLYGDGYYNFGLASRISEGPERGSFDFVLLNPFDAKGNKFGSMVSKIHTNLFVNGIQMSYGFKPNKGWYYKK